MGKGVLKRLKWIMATAIAAAVFALPAVTVSVDDECAGMGDVTWSQRVQANGTTKVVLKADAADGYVFAGWTVDEASAAAWPADLRYAGSLTATVSTNATVTALFAPSAEDGLTFDLADSLPMEVECGEEVFCPLDIDSVSFPTLTFRGLPPGLTYDSHTTTVAGKPTEPGVYQVEATGVNAAGFAFWSGFEMRVGDLVGEHLVGGDAEITLDEYFHAEIDELFAYTGEVVTVTLDGVPPGLTWDDEWQLLYGTPTEPGDYVLKAEVEFSVGGKETATMLLSVVAPDPMEYEVSLDALDMAQVADVLVAEEAEIGIDENGVGILSVTGLPSGLSCEKWRVDGVRHWGLSGRLTKAGNYRVWVSVTDNSGPTQKVVRTSRVIRVEDEPQVYLALSSSDPTRGSVAGGGAVTPGLPVTITATARSGQVFAGWFNEQSERLNLPDGTDYRSPRVVLPAETDYQFTTLVAQFIASANDEAPDLTDLDDVALVMVEGTAFRYEFEVISSSLPQLTFKGLPAGVECIAAGAGKFALVYDYETSRKHPVPGRYQVTATAENRSGRRSTVTFQFTVPNQSDPRIHVLDDYGEYTPGEPIEPISLADAVDFARGESLTVVDLPRGLTYNVRANEQQGIEAHTITGTPTAPGDYTMTITAKVVGSETTNSVGKVTTRYVTTKTSAFITVLPYPELAIELDDDASMSGCKVTGNGNYPVGTKVMLKATAVKGWVFAGWEGLDAVDGLQSLNPKLAYESGDDDVWVYANFLPVDQDFLLVESPLGTEEGSPVELEPGVSIEDAGMESLIADLIYTGSWPTVKVTGLPSGVKFSTSTFLLSGKPTKSGVYHVTVTAKNAGGYSYVRVFDLAVLNADGSLPEEKSLSNAAAIDFAPWLGLTTGVDCASGDHVMTVPAHPENGVAVKKVTVTGLPVGVKAQTQLKEDGTAEVALAGMPTKPGRVVVSVAVTYASGPSAKSQQALVVEDGGSSYLYVQSATEGGSVTGEGVYAAGQKVKLMARSDKGYAFAGWTLAAEEPLKVDGIDYRTSTLSFQMGAVDAISYNAVYGNFVTTAADQTLEMAFTNTVWTITPEVSSEFGYVLTSSSLPKVTVKGLPKGVELDAVRGVLVYSPTAATVPGFYTAEFAVKNTSVTKARTFLLEIRVANRESAVITGLNPALNAYSLPLGVTVDVAALVPQVPAGWEFKVTGLPAGVSFKNGVISGVPSKIGNYTTTITATTGTGAAKRTEVATVVIGVSALPATLVGTFNGWVLNGEGRAVGTLIATVGEKGKISAKVKMPAKTWSFSGASWDALADSTATWGASSKDGAAVSFQVDAENEWPEWSLGGTFHVGEVTYQLRGQRSPYGSKDGSDQAKAELEALVGTVVYSDWTVKIAKSGTVTITGFHNGRKISGSTALMRDDRGYFAELVVFTDKNTAFSVMVELYGSGQINKIITDSVILP